MDISVTEHIGNTLRDELKVKLTRSDKLALTMSAGRLSRTKATSQPFSKINQLVTS